MAMDKIFIQIVRFTQAHTHTQPAAIVCTWP